MTNVVSMDNDLDASRPNWPTPSDHRTEGDSVFSQTPDSATQTGANDYQERIINDFDGRHSRPVDFLKIAGLMEAISRSDQALVKSLIVDIPMSIAGHRSLGRGLSFDVILVQIPDKQKAVLGLRSNFIVYKKLRGLTDALGRVEKGGLLQAALLEIRVLTHGPLKRHPNIIKLVQLLWEPDADLLDHVWPVILLEHAENGTLANFQEDYPHMPFSLKRQLCHDVGNGLLALHGSGIVHGDLKSENVLVCNTDSGVIAKLADFGCAITDLEPSDTVKLPAFTLPWNAPECHDRLPRDILKYTDVYSYGLLVWRVALGGSNPFQFIHCLASLDNVNLQREVELLKQEDKLLPMAQSTLQQPNCSVDVDVALISNILQQTLRIDAVSRDLRGALTLLSESEYLPDHPGEPLVPYDYEYIELSMSTCSMNPMSLELSIIRELEAISSDSGAIGVTACIKLFMLYMGRLEWPGARDKAAKWYLESMRRENGVTFARYAPEVFALLDRPIPPGIKVLESLQQMARDGSYFSLLALKQQFPSNYSATQRHYRLSGGLMCRDSERAIFDWLTTPSLDTSFDALMDQGRGGYSLVDTTVTSNSGDQMIHAAARIGSAYVLLKLFAFGVDINEVNDYGETALFQACRAGNLIPLRLLLSRGADVTIAAWNGETALHWIIGFDDEDINEATELLMVHGALPSLFSAVPRGSSSGVKHLDLYGTPLHYAILARNDTAVRTLLSKDADPFFEYEHEKFDDLYTFTPFSLAVSLLLPNIVRGILTAGHCADKLKVYLAAKKESILFLIVEMTSSTKIFERVSYGEAFVPAIIELIDLIRPLEDESMIALQTTQFGMSLLHASIVYGQPVEVIEHLLKTGSRKDLERVSELRQHTPLQAAIYLNRRDTFKVLLNHGADIHRILSIGGMSYLEFCATIGLEGKYFAQELIARGAVPKRIRDMRPSNGGLDAASMAPAFIAIMVGNFELATYLKTFESPPGSIPPNIPVLYGLLSSTSRLPVSRLEYLLEPHDCIGTVALDDNKDEKRNCFHALAMSKGGPELEALVNIRYLLQQSKSRQQPHLLDQADAKGITPLNIAAMLGRFELVREMLLAGANPNSGVVTCANAAILGLKRLQKCPSRPLDSRDQADLTRREARCLQEDFESIIILSRQFGSLEPEVIAGLPKADISKIVGGNFKAIWTTAKTVLNGSYKRYQHHATRQDRFTSSNDSGASTGTKAGFRGKVQETKRFAKWYFGPASGIDSKPQHS